MATSASSLCAKSLQISIMRRWTSGSIAFLASGRLIVTYAMRSLASYRTFSAITTPWFGWALHPPTPAALLAGVRAGPGRRGLGGRAVDRLPDDAVQLALGHLVREVEVQPVRHARGRPGGGVLLGEVPRGLDDREGLAVARGGRERVVHRGGQVVEEPERSHAEDQLHRPHHREAVVAGVHDRALGGILGQRDVGERGDAARGQLEVELALEAVVARFRRGQRAGRRRGVGDR